MAECPYPGLPAFQESDAPRFFGRETETRVVCDNLRAARLTVLYGASGAGKSSMLRAGVAYQLKATARAEFLRSGVIDSAVVVFGSWRNQPSDAIGAAVREEIAALMGVEAGPSNATGTLLEHLQGLPKQFEGDLLIVLDQFEEYFEYHRDGRFLEELCDVMESGLPVNILLALRDDAIASLDRLRKRAPSVFDNLLRVEHLSQQASLEAIRKPLLGSGMSISDELSVNVAAQIAERGAGLVQAAFLQLVMRRWWEEETRLESAELQEGTLKNLGGVDRILERHFDQSMEKLSRVERATATRVFRGLVTSSGRKMAKTCTELAVEEHLAATEVEAVLDQLAAQRILAVVPLPAGADANDKCFEFAQDQLAARALKWRTADELKRAQKERRIAQGVLAIVAALFVAACAVAAYAWRESHEARARELAADAIEAIPKSPELAILLAAQAVQQTYANPILRRFPVPAAEDALHRAILDSPFRQSWSYGAPGAVRALAVSPDGKLYAAAGGGSSVKIFNVDAPSKSLRTLVGHTGQVMGLAWRKDSQQLATASLDQTVKIWNAADGTLLRSVPMHDQMYSVAWSTDGSRIAAGGVHVTAVMDAADGRILRDLGEGTGWYGVAWNSGGNLLAAAGTIGAVTVFDGAGSEVLARYRGGTGGIAWRQGFDDLAIASSTGSISLQILRMKETQTLWATIGDLTETGRALGWSGDGKSLAVATFGGVDLIDGLSGRRTMTMSGTASATAVAWTVWNQILTGDSAGRLTLWEPIKRERVAIESPQLEIESLAWGPDGRRLLAGGAGALEVWDSDSGGRQTTSEAFWQGSKKASWCGTGKVAQGPAMWDATSGARLYDWGGANSLITAEACSPKGDLVAVSSVHKTSILTAADGKAATVMKLAPQQSGFISSLAWSPNQQRLAGIDQRNVLVWNTKTGEVDGAFRCPNNAAATSVAWNPDSNLVAAAGVGSIWIWDVKTGKLLRELNGHAGLVYSIAWSADNRIASAGDDKTVRIWDGSSGEELMQLRAHSTYVKAVAWSPDGSRLASGDGNGVVLTYEMREDALLKLARSRVSRTKFTDAECRLYFPGAACPVMPEIR